MHSTQLEKKNAALKDTAKGEGKKCEKGKKKTKTKKSEKKTL
jgi:hypothetical protein